MPQQKLQEQLPVNRPPTPNPFISPLYIKHQLNSTLPSTVTGVSPSRGETHQLSRVELLRFLHRKRRDTTIRQLKAMELAHISQTSWASELSTRGGNSEESGLSEAVKGLVLEDCVEQGNQTSVSRCKLCGRSN